MKMKKMILASFILAAICLLTACAKNPDTYTGGDTDIGGMFHDIFFGEEQEELSFTLDIKNDTSVKLYSAAIRWCVEGRVVGSRGALDAADHYLLLPGQVLTCKFLADDFPDGELSEVQIDVFVKEAPGDADFVSCGTLLIPSPVYGQAYPVRLAEDETSEETYFLVSEDESLCFVETKRQAESQTAESIDLVGPWHLDETKNDLTSTEMMDVFPGFAEWGAGMEIRSNGQMSWYIGAVGGSGTYSIEENTLHAELIDAMEQTEMSMDFLVTGNNELKMTYADMQFIWVYGDRVEIPANNN